MPTLSQRFGVGDPTRTRSSEWIVIWRSNASDVYLAARTLGGILKVSIHESGRCHVHSPDPRYWCSPGPPPSRFLDVWSIDPQVKLAYPFGVIVPASELRSAEWAAHRDKGTTWIPVQPPDAIEIALFLVRTDTPFETALASAGWHTTIVSTQLPDGRILLVVAGNTTAHLSRQSEIQRIQEQAKRLIATRETPPDNPRMLLFASNEEGTRRFVEVAV